MEAEKGSFLGFFFPCTSGRNSQTPLISEIELLGTLSAHVPPPPPAPSTHTHTPIPWNFTVPRLVSKNLKVGWPGDTHGRASSVRFLIQALCYWKTRRESRPYRGDVGESPGALIWKSSNRILNAAAWKPLSTVLSFPFKAGRTVSWDNTKVFLEVYIDFFCPWNLLYSIITQKQQMKKASCGEISLKAAAWWWY